MKEQKAHDYAKNDWKHFSNGVTLSQKDAESSSKEAFINGWDAAMKEMEIFREIVEFMRDYCNPTEPGLFETYANLLMNAEAALDRL